MRNENVGIPHLKTAALERILPALLFVSIHTISTVQFGKTNGQDKPTGRLYFIFPFFGVNINNFQHMERKIFGELWVKEGFSVYNAYTYIAIKTTLQKIPLIVRDI